MSEEWHLSRYNLFANIPDTDQVGCVNLLKGTYSILSTEGAYLLYNNQINEYFKNQGFIVNYDELEALEFLSRKVCGFSKTVNFTICPTMNCNFNCPYCFEKHRIGKMSIETQNNILNFIKKTIKIYNAKEMSVTWFGGEPLLAIDVIISLSKRIINFCDEENIQYNSSIITNGYLLSQEIVDKLFENKVNNYQITLDGINEKHDKTRHLINNKPTFNKIINNLTNLKINGKINIRYNLYNDNIEEVEDFKKYIENLKKNSKNNIGYYTAFINNNENALKRKKQIKYLNSKDFSYFEMDKKIQKFNSYNSNYCGAQTLSFIVIDELGNLYKCWEDLGDDKKSFGKVEKWNINNPIGTADNPQILIDYINTGSIFKDKECLECVWLPICQKGCPHRRLFYNKECVPYKNKPEEFVLKFINFNQKQEGIEVSFDINKINFNTNKE